jgi:hypothetical protein
VAVCGSFAIAAVVISDAMGNVILAATQKLLETDAHGTYALQGEALAALLTVRLAVSSGCSNLQFEGDACDKQLFLIFLLVFCSFCFKYLV